MARVSIKGMSCQHCVESTKKALEEIPGISNVKVILEKAEASYNGDVDKELVNDVVTKIGFEVVE